MITENVNRVAHTRFNSVREMIAETVNHPQVARSIPRHQFTGRKFADSETLETEANSVWSEGMQRLDSTRDRLRDKTMPQPKTRKRRRVYSEHDGSEFDYDRFRTGAPYWRSARREKRTGLTTVSVAVDLCAVYSRTAESIVWRGMAAIAMTELMEHAGCRVELFAYAAVNPRRSVRGDVGSLWSVCLKRASEPLDCSTLVNATSGWFFRTFGIAASYIGREYRADGCGQVISQTREQLAAHIGQPIDVLIDNVWTESATVSAVENAIQQIENN